VAGTALLDQIAADHPGIRKACATAATARLVERTGTLGIDVEITTRKPGTRDFTRISRRWAVERTYGRLMLHLRLDRDYGMLPARPEAMIDLAMTSFMARRSRDETSDGNDP